MEATITDSTPGNMKEYPRKTHWILHIKEYLPAEEQSWKLQKVFPVQYSCVFKDLNKMKKLTIIFLF